MEQINVLKLSKFSLCSCQRQFFNCT